ncbi:MAG: hypothetical protein LQ340_004450 [Diploschistes diacapsis]|nr:MAG: hypothetical protein LQ340_004450 [Diploschistes diacapsis]
MSSPQMATGSQPSLITTGLIVVSVIFPVLSLLSIVLRFMARKSARQDFMADDWWIAAAWIASLSVSINSWYFGATTGVNYFTVDPLSGIEDSLEVIEDLLIS